MRAKRKTSEYFTNVTISFQLTEKNEDYFFSIAFCSPNRRKYLRLTPNTFVLLLKKTNIIIDIHHMALWLLTVGATDATKLTVVSIHVDRLRAGRGGKRIQVPSICSGSLRKCNWEGYTCAMFLLI
jgi:hypothetical protein